MLPPPPCILLAELFMFRAAAGLFGPRTWNDSYQLVEAELMRKVLKAPEAHVAKSRFGGLQVLKMIETCCLNVGYVI